MWARAGRDRRPRLEDDGCLAGEHGRELGGGQDRVLGRVGALDDYGSGRHLHWRAAIHGHVDPRSRVAAVVHPVVEQARVPPHRDAPARRAEVGLRRHRVLVVAELVADVREQLDERDLEVGRVALVPVGRDHGHPVEHQPPEARVVLGQVVDLGLVEGPGRAVAHR